MAKNSKTASNRNIQKKSIILNNKIKNNETNEKNNFLSKIYLYDKYIFELLISFVCGLIIFRISLPKTISVITLLSNLYLVIKYHNNIPLFFCLMSILYFNYSFIFSKYLFSTSTLTNAYNQIRYLDTMDKGLYSVYLFINIIGIFLSGIVENNGVNITSLSKPYNYKFSKIMGYFIIVTIAVLLILAYLLNVNFIKAMHEYSLILFIFGFLLCKNNRLQIVFLVFLMLISTGLNLITGGRIISLLPCIAFFFIFLTPYFNYAKILVVMFLGVIFFTAFGLYGDIMEASRDYSILTPKYVIITIGERKFTLDTSISAYWTGLTFIEQRQFGLESTTDDFKDYLIKYTIFGNKFGNYKHVYEKSRENYTHYWGGYLTSYFYYWMGYLGIALISCYIGCLFKMLRSSGTSSSNFKIILSIYICATLPRWYLYYPSPLFRGILFLSLFYLLITFISKWRFLNDN